MKGLCTVSSGGVVNLLISGGDLPEVGHYYFLESATEGTGAQNRTFHALTLEYFKSGMHSYDATDYSDFKNQIKKHLGQGFESYVYVDYSTKDYPFMNDCKNKKDLPEWVIDANRIKPGMIRGKLKSWSNYTKKQRKTTIDNVISEMLQSGINTHIFQEILKGMNYDG